MNVKTVRFSSTVIYGLKGGWGAVLNGFTFGEDFRDFCVAGTESTVNFEAVCIVKERATKREQHFLWSKRKIL